MGTLKDRVVLDPVSIHGQYKWLVNGSDPSHSLSKYLILSTQKRLCLNPQTSPEARLLGVPNTDTSQEFGGFWMSRVC